ncbi:MAG: hypothetical protein R3D80_15620 [Paracoccaceae bacterium]
MPRAAREKDGTRDEDEDEDEDDDDDRDEEDDDREDKDGDEREDDDRDDDRDDGAAVSAGSDGRHGSGSGDDPGDVGRVELTATGINVIYRDGLTAKCWQTGCTGARMPPAGCWTAAPRSAPIWCGCAPWQGGAPSRPRPRPRPTPPPPAFRKRSACAATT